MASVVANRYARALADVVARTGEYHKTLEEIEDFAALLRESAELREVCETPAVTMTQKANVLDTILTRLGVSRVTRDFLRVLLSHYRMSLLEEVIPAFRKISDDRLGVVRVRVFSASELSEADRKALGERFGELT
jgi:F-type H+-transporting ATPase subunit delta